MFSERDTIWRFNQSLLNEFQTNLMECLLKRLVKFKTWRNKNVRKQKILHFSRYVSKAC